MTNASALNSRIYGRLVELYPEDLRREYGDEMIFVFAEELRDANFARALRVWRNALSEFLRLALPGCWTNRRSACPRFRLLLRSSA